MKMKRNERTWRPLRKRGVERGPGIARLHMQQREDTLKLPIQFQYDPLRQRCSHGDVQTESPQTRTIKMQEIFVQCPRTSQGLKYNIPSKLKCTVFVMKKWYQVKIWSLPF